MNLENEIRQLKASNQVMTLLLSAALAQLELRAMLGVDSIIERFRLDMLAAVHSMGKGDCSESAQLQALMEVENLYQPVLDRLTQYVSEAKRQSLEASQ